MRSCLLIVLFVASAATSTQGTLPPQRSPVDGTASDSRSTRVPTRLPDWFPVPPAVRPDSILRIRPWRPERRNLRVGTIAGRPLARLASEDAGIAHVGTEVDTEPDVPDPDLPSPGDPPPAPVLPSDIPQGEAIPLDGAARTEQAPRAEQKPADGRSSFAWIGGTGDQLGMLEWVDRDLAVFDYSLTDRSNVRAEPGFAMRWLTGPDTTDLPPYLFSLLIDVGAGFRPHPDWNFDVVVSPSWNTDFANKSAQLFRLPWQAVNTVTLGDEWKLVLGVTDLDREDIQLLPVAGMIYKPADGGQEWNLVFPYPKAALRLTRTDDASTWCYVAGELGGGSFTIQRPGAVHDIVTLRDYRLLFGWERRRNKRHASRIEAGWIFGRAVEYESGLGDYHPGQTAMIRLSSDY